jgi:hypothetical protein
MACKKWDNVDSQFPSIINMFESESNLEECNMFLEDYDEYNATKWLMQKMRSIEAKINAIKQEDAKRELQVVLA